MTQYKISPEIICKTESSDLLKLLLKNMIKPLKLFCSPLCHDAVGITITCLAALVLEFKLDYLCMYAYMKDSLVMQFNDER